MEAYQIWLLKKDFVAFWVEKPIDHIKTSDIRFDLDRMVREQKPVVVQPTFVINNSQGKGRKQRWLWEEIFWDTESLSQNSGNPGWNDRDFWNFWDRFLRDLDVWKIPKSIIFEAQKTVKKNLKFYDLQKIPEKLQINKNIKKLVVHIFTLFSIMIF